MGITGQVTGQVTGCVTGSILSPPWMNIVTTLLLAAYYDSVETCQLQVRGRGIPSSTHTETYTLPDAEGIYQDYGEDEPAWSLGRVVKVFGGGTNLTAVGTTLIPVIEEEEPGLWRVEFPAGLGSLSENIVKGDVFDTSLMSLDNQIGRVTVVANRQLVNSEKIIVLLGTNIPSVSINIDSSDDLLNTLIRTNFRASTGVGYFNTYFSMYPIGALETPLTIWIEDWQLEQSTGRTDLVTPSEVFPVTVATNPVTKVFYTENGNTVDANGIVTEGVGTPLSPHPQVYSGTGATNQQIYSNDQTNAVYTTTNGTVLKDASGIDGAANGGCTITATSANCTCIASAVTAASGTHAAAFIVSRKTGTGTIELTVDGGTTWQDITAQITASYLSIAVDQAAVTDPSIGIRIVTSGDEIEIGNASCYADSTKENTKNLPAIITSGATASIDENRPTYDAANYSNARMGGSMRVRPDGAGNISAEFLSLVGSNITLTDIGLNTLSLAGNVGEVNSGGFVVYDDLMWLHVNGSEVEGPYSGEIHNLGKPEILGPDEVTNGDFDTDLSGWTLSHLDTDASRVSWTPDGARIESDGTGASIGQNCMTVGKTYKTTLNIASITGAVYLYSAAGSSPLFSTTGEHTYTATATSSSVVINRSGPCDAVISSITVKEVTQEYLAPTDVIMGDLNEYPMGLWDIWTTVTGTRQQMIDKVKERLT